MRWWDGLGWLHFPITGHQATNYLSGLASPVLVLSRDWGYDFMPCSPSSLESGSLAAVKSSQRYMSRYLRRCGAGHVPNIGENKICR